MIEDIDRLYLCKKDGEEVYVDDIDSLSQTHIDGIRFIYSQFKKRKPGVILNGPFGQGKSMLTACFLKAVQHLLKKPILIISSKDIVKWEKYFQSSDIAVESNNYFAKKKVFINSRDNIAFLRPREWSILVVCDNVVTKEILQADFKCDFKIWITEIDLKDNLKTLHNIYFWLTNEKFDLNQFTPSEGVFDKITKGVLLDTFLEDVCFACLESGMPGVENSEFQDTVETKVCVSKKNKDVTGTKIKRSKRILNDEDLPDVLCENKTISFAHKDNTINDVKIRKVDVTTEEPPTEILDTKDMVDGDESPSLINYAENNLDQSLSNIDKLHNRNDTDMESEDSCSFGQAIQEIEDNENISENTDTKHIVTERLDGDSIDKNISINKASSPNNERTTIKISQTIDSKLMELEEMALKMFKGSVLDGLF